MNDPQKQLNDYYRRQSFPADRGEFVLAQGRAWALRRRRKVVFWCTVGIAATLAAAGGVVWMNRSGPPAPTSIEIAAGTIELPALSERIVTFFSSPDHQLDRVSPDQPELLAWLRGQGAPASLTVPDPLDALDVLGCQVLEVNGERVYILCFYLDGGPREPGDHAAAGTQPMMKKPPALLHLVSIPRAKFDHAPRPGDPVQLSVEGAWQFATWARGDVVYIAASPAEAERFQAVVEALPG